MDWHLLIAEGGRVEYLTEHHELGLFAEADYVDAFARAGLKTEVLAGAAEGRDRFVARA